MGPFGTHKSRLVWASLAGISALLLTAGLLLFLSRGQVLARPLARPRQDGLEVQKEVSSSEASPGDTLAYTVTIANSEHDSVDVWMTDTLPAELDSISDLTTIVGDVGHEGGVITWSHRMPALSENWITFRAEISPDLPYDGWITNTVEVATPVQSLTRMTRTYVHRPVPIVEASKSVYPDPVPPGERLTYTVRITNTGDKTADIVSMSDPLPLEATYATGTLTATAGSYGEASGSITWTGSLAPSGGKVIITFSAVTSDSLPAYTRFTNTAGITGAGSLVSASAGATALDLMHHWLPIAMSNYPPRTWLPLVFRSWPPIPSLSISAPANHYYTASWELNWQTVVDHYVLEQARSEDFLAVTEMWTTTQSSEVIGPFHCPYHYRVRADKADDWGRGIWSNVVQSDLSSPIPVLDGAIIPDGDGRFSVSWSSVPDPGVPYAAVDRYVLQQARTADFSDVTGSWTTNGTWQVVGPFSCHYLYRVRADDDDCWGQGEWSDAVLSAPNPPIPVLYDIPDPDQEGSYVVSWSSVPDPGIPHAAVDRYVLQQARTADFSDVTGSWTTNEASQIVGPLHCSYYYRVRADDDDCWGWGPWSDAVLSDPNPPIPVLNDIPDPDGNGSYVVSWSSVPDPGIPHAAVDTYVLQEATDSAFTQVTGEWQTTQTSQSIQRDPTGQTLYYRVRADDVDCWGMGPWSEIKSVVLELPVYYDGFDDSNSGWPVVAKRVIPETDSYYRLRYENGQYRIMIDAGGPNIWFHQPDALAPYRPPTDKYCVETLVLLEKGKDPYGNWNYYPYWANGGLVFGANEENTRLYALCTTVGGDDRMGWYIVKNPDYDYPRMGCNHLEGVAGGEDAGALAIDSWHKFQVSVDGDYATVHIDGIDKGTYLMHGLSATTRVGLIGGDYEITPVDYRFAYFRVTPNAACTP